MGLPFKQMIKARAEQGDLKWMFTDYSGDILFADHKQPGELAFVCSLGIAVHIDTNGAYLDEQRIARIMQSPVNAVSISLDAATDATYRRIRVGSPPIDKVFRKIQALVNARDFSPHRGEAGGTTGSRCPLPVHDSLGFSHGARQW